MHKFLFNALIILSTVFLASCSKESKETKEDSNADKGLGISYEVPENYQANQRGNETSIESSTSAIYMAKSEGRMDVDTVIKNEEEKFPTFKVVDKAEEDVNGETVNKIVYTLTESAENNDKIKLKGILALFIEKNLVVNFLSTEDQFDDDSGEFDDFLDSIKFE